MDPDHEESNWNFPQRRSSSGVSIGRRRKSSSIKIVRTDYQDQPQPLIAQSADTETDSSLLLDPSLLFSSSMPQLNLRLSVVNTFSDGSIYDFELLDLDDSEENVSDQSSENSTEEKRDHSKSDPIFDLNVGNQLDSPLTRSSTPRVAPRSLTWSKSTTTLLNRNNFRKSVPKELKRPSHKKRKAFLSMQRKDKVFDNIEFKKDRNGNIVVSAGTLEELVKVCSSPDYTNTQMLNLFLASYPTFSCDLDILHAFSIRYSQSETIADNPEHSHAIRLRVANFLKLWLTDFEEDFKDKQGLFVQQYSSFVEKYLRKDFPEIADRLGQMIQMINPNITTYSYFPQNDLNIPTKVNVNDFLTFDIENFAKQLTLSTQRIYTRINKRECFAEIFSKSLEREHKSPNISDMIAHFNKISSWAALQVVKQSKVEKRVKTMKFLIRLSYECRMLNNFDTAFSIMSGLSCAAVYRLKNTKYKLEKDSKIMETLNHLEMMIDPNDNHQFYRECLDHCNPPAIPYLGLYLKEFTLVGEGNSNNLRLTEDGPQVINLDKRRKVDIVSENLMMYQSYPYEYEEIPYMLNYIEQAEHVEDSELWRFSHQAEQKEI
eukprot:TRINITY_DN7346_c0_g1_i1.p1 TRINITY_DN7346_c0_g1~~TRINITY_DN7346_c0_g1_i1.p1  ORF type:complete len:601 (+),score=101.18 TRINITY_DN7346_c0_g1_i1:55-1857(+)